jgi:DNA-binding FadR family transcriptional regulator
MHASEPILRRKLSDEVFDRLVRVIESGELPPDAQLPSERELMARYGVGRPAVREALQALEQMGLIAISHGERAKVTRPTAQNMMSRIEHSARHLLSTSPQSLGHLKEAREFFEVGMAAQAALSATPEDIEELAVAIATQEAQVGRDPAAFVQADMAFHARLAAASRNPIFEAVSRAMLQWLSRYHVGLLRWQGHEDITLREHREVLARIVAGDAEGAAEAMRAHLRRSSGTYRQKRSRTRSTTFT